MNSKLVKKIAAVADANLKAALSVVQKHVDARDTPLVIGSTTVPVRHQHTVVPVILFVCSGDEVNEHLVLSHMTELVPNITIFMIDWSIDKPRNATIRVSSSKGTVVTLPIQRFDTFGAVREKFAQNKSTHLQYIPVLICGLNPVIVSFSSDSKAHLYDQIRLGQNNASFAGFLQDCADAFEVVQMRNKSRVIPLMYAWWKFHPDSVAVEHHENLPATEQAQQIIAFILKGFNPSNWNIIAQMIKSDGTFWPEQYKSSITAMDAYVEFRRLCIKGGYTLVNELENMIKLNVNAALTEQNPLIQDRLHQTRNDLNIVKQWAFEQIMLSVPHESTLASFSTSILNFFV